MLGAIAYVAYRIAKRAGRQPVDPDPETDAIMWLLGGILVFWPIALAWVIHESLNTQDKTKYWLMAISPGILLLTLIPLGWEVYFLFGFVAAATTVSAAAMRED